MDGYLLDTNIIRYWLDHTTPEHPLVQRRVDGLDEQSLLVVSAVTLGELDYGLRCLGDEEYREQEESHLGFIRKQIPEVVEVGSNTHPYYGAIRSALFERYGRRERKRKKLRPEQLADPETSLTLGIDENDLWIAAQAVEHNLVLVTHDAMRRIRSIADELRVDDWAAPDDPTSNATQGIGS